MKDKIESIEGREKIIQMICSICGHVFTEGKQKIKLEYDRENHLSDILEKIALATLNKEIEVCPICYATKKEIKTVYSGNRLE